MKDGNHNKEKVPKMRRMRARNKSGTVTYIVQTANEAQNSGAKNEVVDEKAVQDQKNIKVRIEQERVVAMLENIAMTSKDIDYRVLDELNSVESDQSFSLKTFLNSLEMLAHHWNMIRKEKYGHRVANHGQLDVYINEIPRATNESKIFNIKTFVLSCKTPYMKTKDGAKVFISKEYSNAAGKLHLSFYTLHDFMVKDLTKKLEAINRVNNRHSILAFFKTIFSSGQDGVYHPLFKETVLLKNVKKQLKIFELCIRNFEQTYIAMIKDLQEKTFKLNLDLPFEKSIIMKKREGTKTKLIDNQLFDMDGNLLQSMKNSFNQSMLGGSIQSRIGSEFTQSVVGNQFVGTGPQCHVSPMGNLRKQAHEDLSVKPTSSSQGPSRLRQTISPVTQDRKENLSRSSRNSGFRPLHSLQQVDVQNIFKKKQDYAGSMVSTSTNPNQLACVQKKTITPQIIKHNYRPMHNMNTQPNNVTNDELVVKFIDMNDDKENIFSQSNLMKASMNNFAFQTPNPHHQLLASIKNKFQVTQTTAVSNGTNTPGQYLLNSAAGTIINRNSNLQQEYPQSTNMMKTKYPNDPQVQFNIADQDYDQVTNFEENRAHYKHQMMNNRRVIKTSRNLFNSSKDNIELQKEPIQKERGSMNLEEVMGFHKHNGSNDNSNNFMQGYGGGLRSAQRSVIMTNNKEDNSFDQSSNSSYLESELSNDDERNEINQSSMMRASRLESRIDQINPTDLMAYNNLIEQFNYGN